MNPKAISLYVGTLMLAAIGLLLLLVAGCCPKKKKVCPCTQKIKVEMRCKFVPVKKDGTTYLEPKFTCIDAK